MWGPRSIAKLVNINFNVANNYGLWYTNNYSFPVAFVHQRSTYNWGPTLYSFSVLFTSEIHDSFYGDFYGNLTVSYWTWP